MGRRAIEVASFQSALDPLADMRGRAGCVVEVAVRPGWSVVDRLAVRRLARPLPDGVGGSGPFRLRDGWAEVWVHGQAYRVRSWLWTWAELNVRPALLGDYELRIFPDREVES